MWMHILINCSTIFAECLPNSIFSELRMQQWIKQTKTFPLGAYILEEEMGIETMSTLYYI